MNTEGDSRSNRGAAIKDGPGVTVAERSSLLTVEVIVEDERWRTLGDVEALIASAVQAVARHVGTAGEACMLLTSDAESRRLNAGYRGQDKPTNVLSFPPAGPMGLTGTTTLLGDIALAYETVAREAADLAIPPSAHLQHLAVHGLLHLLGHDHETDAEAARMEGLEIEILDAIGVANPYSDS